MAAKRDIGRQQNGTRRRIRTDPLFFLLIAVISGTYVLLICAMLLADAVYVATSDMREYVRLDFSTDDQDVAIPAGTRIENSDSCS